MSIASVILIMMSGMPSLAVERMPEFLKQTPQELFSQANEYLELKNSPDSALLCLTALITLGEVGRYSDKESPIYAIAYNTRGAIYASRYGNYAEGALNMLKGLDIAERYGLDDWETRISFNLDAMKYEQGILMGQDSISEVTLTRFLNTLSRLDPTQDEDLMLPIMLSAAEIGIRENRPETAMKALSTIPEASELSIPLNKVNDSMLHLNNHEYDLAVKAIDDVLPLLKEPTGFMSHQFNAVFYLIRAHILLAAGREAEALKAYEEIIARNEKDEDLFANFEIYQQLQNYYEQKGATARAADIELKKYNVKDRLINRSQTLSLEGSKALYNEEKLKQEIVEQVSRAHTYKIVFWISISFLLILALLLILLYNKYRQLSASRKIIVRNDKEYFQLQPSLKEASLETHPEPEDENTRIFNKVQEVAQSNDEIYTEEFNTGKLAALTGEKPSAVSAAISAATGETTSQFLARVRIREACRRINDTANYGTYTIEAIGQSVGYRSRSHFGSVFKKIVGMTPSEYVAKLHNQ